MIALLGMHAAGLDRLNGASSGALVAWMKLHPDNDQFSIGLRLQSFGYAGVLEEV